MSNRLNRPDMQGFGEVDLLADILAESHRGVVYARRSFPAVFALDLEGTDTCAFYAVTRGELIIRVPSGGRHLLGEGDIGLVAGAHVIASDAHTPPERFSLERVRDLAEDEEALRMLCWAYLVDVPNHPVFSRLPDVLVLRVGERDASVDALIAVLEQEFAAFAPGGRTVASRLIDAMLVCILRHWIRTDESTWIRGLRDPVLARALGLMHNDFARSWTLATLARASGASRATLARNFAAVVGTPPMQFLTRRRLSVAEGLLKRTTMTLDEIAAEVGYGSGFALSKAFKREYGMAPTDVR